MNMMCGGNGGKHPFGGENALEMRRLREGGGGGKVVENPKFPVDKSANLVENFLPYFGGLIHQVFHRVFHGFIGVFHQVIHR